MGLVLVEQPYDDIIVLARKLWLQIRKVKQLSKPKLVAEIVRLSGFPKCEAR